MNDPTLTIETSPEGVGRLVIHVNRRNPARGLAFLQKILPALSILDRQIRDPEGSHKDEERK